VQATQRNLHEVGSGTVRDRLANRVGVYTKITGGRVVVTDKPADLFDSAINRVAFGLIKAAGKFSTDYPGWEDVGRVGDKEKLAGMVKRLNTEAVEKYTAIVDAMCNTILTESHPVTTRTRKAEKAADNSVDEIEV
jgi:hypothetical protein